MSPRFELCPAYRVWTTEAKSYKKRTLDLEFQLDAIDYEAKNFIHADLDAETFQQMQSWQEIRRRLLIGLRRENA